jgi:excisionase family DNA binding protein
MVMDRKRNPLEGEVFVGVTRAAELLKTSVYTIYKLLEEGELRGYRLRKGGWWQISYASIIDKISRLSEDCFQGSPCAASGHPARGRK